MPYTLHRARVIADTIHRRVYPTRYSESKNPITVREPAVCDRNSKIRRLPRILLTTVYRRDIYKTARVKIFRIKSSNNWVKAQTSWDSKACKG